MSFQARVASGCIFHPPAWNRPAWTDASDGAHQFGGPRCGTQKGPKESKWVRPFLSVTPVPSVTKKPRRIFSKWVKLSGSKMECRRHPNPQTYTASPARCRREEIHRNIGSGTT